MESHDLRWLGRLYRPCSDVPDVRVSLSLWNLVCWCWVCVPVHCSIIPSGKIEGKGQGADLTGWSNPCYGVCYTTGIRDSCQWPSLLDVQEKAHEILPLFKLCTSSWLKRSRCKSYRFNSIINLEYDFFIVGSDLFSLLFHEYSHESSLMSLNLTVFGWFIFCCCTSGPSWIIMLI